MFVPRLRHVPFLPASVVGLLLTLAACGGGGAVISTPPDSGPEPYPSVPLPWGHGVEEGEFTLAPGSSDEIGNVVISCPTGGLACSLQVAEDGSVTYTRTGGTPVVNVRGYARDNPTAEDLLDHWNSSTTLQTAMGLSTSNVSRIAEGERTLRALLDSVDGNADNAAYRFRNVQPGSVEILGERNGITFGHWRSGPAGTINIEFDWSAVPFLGPEARAAIERAGKAWSYHILDDLEPASLVVDFGDTSLDGHYETDGILVILDFEEDGCGGGAACASALFGDDSIQQPRFGVITYTRQVAGFPGNPNNWSADWTDQQGTTAHELGHILYATEDYNSHINFEDGTFEGPRARAANGGLAVPFRRFFPEDFYASVPFGTPGAEVDYGHPGGCVDSVMHYYTPDCDHILMPGGDAGLWENGPSALDLAILADSGYELLDTERASAPETYGYGAWGRWSAWGVGVSRTLRFSGDHVWHNAAPFEGDTLWAGADAFGIAPNTTLILNSTLTDAATWSGSLLGVDLGQDMLPPVVGDAELQVELSTLAGTARFSNLNVLVEQELSSFRAPSLEYHVDVTGNHFADAANHLAGSFFGPAHEEMAGVLDDRRSHVNLLAGFGGKR